MEGLRLPEWSFPSTGLVIWLGLTVGCIIHTFCFVHPILERRQIKFMNLAISASHGYLFTPLLLFWINTILPSLLSKCVGRLPVLPLNWVTVFLHETYLFSLSVHLAPCVYFGQFSRQNPVVSLIVRFILQNLLCLRR